jgi:hypothetical protein
MKNLFIDRLLLTLIFLFLFVFFFTVIMLFMNLMVEFFSNTLIDNNYNTIFTNWTNLCREQGGIVQSTSPTNFECFKDGKIILHLN